MAIICRLFLKEFTRTISFKPHLVLCETKDHLPKKVTPIFLDIYSPTYSSGQLPACTCKPFLSVFYCWLSEIFVNFHLVLHNFTCLGLGWIFSRHYVIVWKHDLTILNDLLCLCIWRRNYFSYMGLGLLKPKEIVRKGLCNYSRSNFFRNFCQYLNILRYLSLWTELTTCTGCSSHQPTHVSQKYIYLLFKVYVFTLCNFYLSKNLGELFCM